MSNRKAENQAPAPTTTAPTTTALATTSVDFAADAGAGMEGAGSDSFAIPFLAILQSNSPQVDEGGGAAIPGAKAGFFFDNVSSRLFDGQKGVLVVPCAYRRVFLQWGPRGGDGAGFKGEHTAEAVAKLRAEGKLVDLDGKLLIPKPDGTVSPKLCDRISDTRNHYVLLVDEQTGGWKQALISLTSTQIKKSKMLMSALASVQMKNANGQTFTPPTFANLVRATTVRESNDKGNWYGIRFELAKFVDRPEVYAAAKAFNASVAAGAVEARYMDAEAGDASHDTDRM